jgi:hypothetical protein
MEHGLWIIGGISGINTVLLLKLAFAAGQQVQKIRDLEWRINRLPCQKNAAQLAEENACDLS